MDADKRCCDGPWGRREWMIVCKSRSALTAGIMALQRKTHICVCVCVCKDADLWAVLLVAYSGEGCLTWGRSARSHLFQVALAPALLCWLPLSLPHSSVSPPVIPPLSPPAFFPCERSVWLENELLPNLNLLWRLLKDQKTDGEITQPFPKWQILKKWYHNEEMKKKKTF